MDPGRGHLGSYPPPPEDPKWPTCPLKVGGRCYFLELWVFFTARSVTRSQRRVKKGDLCVFEVPNSKMLFRAKKNIIGVGWLQNENQLKTNFSAKQNVHFPSSQRNVKFAQLFAIFWEVGNKLVGLPPL